MGQVRGRHLRRAVHPRRGAQPRPRRGRLGAAGGPLHDAVAHLVGRRRRARRGHPPGDQVGRDAVDPAHPHRPEEVGVVVEQREGRPVAGGGAVAGAALALHVAAHLGVPERAVGDADARAGVRGRDRITIAGKAEVGGAQTQVRGSGAIVGAEHGRVGGYRGVRRGGRGGAAAGERRAREESESDVSQAGGGAHRAGRLPRRLGPPTGLLAPSRGHVTVSPPSSG